MIRNENETTEDLVRRMTRVLEDIVLENAMDPIDWSQVDPATIEVYQLALNKLRSNGP
jgi:hypothetical protein